MLEVGLGARDCHCARGLQDGPRLVKHILCGAGARGLGASCAALPVAPKDLVSSNISCVGQGQGAGTGGSRVEPTSPKPEGVVRGGNEAWEE